MTSAAQIRAFNRFYTNFLGLLNNRILDSQLSLSASRVLYELAQNSQTNAVQLATLLQMDQGYLSMIVKKFEKSDYLQQTTSALDIRIKTLALSAQGKLLLFLIHSDVYIIQ